MKDYKTLLKIVAIYLIEDVCGVPENPLNCVLKVAIVDE